MFNLKIIRDSFSYLLVSILGWIELSLIIYSSNGISIDFNAGTLTFVLFIAVFFYFDYNYIWGCYSLKTVPIFSFFEFYTVIQILYIIEFLPYYVNNISDLIFSGFLVFLLNFFLVPYVLKFILLEFLLRFLFKILSKNIFSCTSLKKIRLFPINKKILYIIKDVGTIFWFFGLICVAIIYTFEL